jgi:hypothetical protein
MELQEGTYQIPDGLSVKQVGRTIEVYKSKKKTLEEGDYRCKDCIHYVKGLGKQSGGWETMVCEEKPAGEDKKGVMRYYAMSKYGKPCESFKLREDE